MSQYRNPTKARKKKTNRTTIIAAVVVLIVAAGLVTIYTHRHNEAKKSPAVSTTTTPHPTTDKTSPSTPPTTEDKQSGGPTQPTPQPATPAPPSDVKPTKPYGAFVSNHKPGQNNSPLEEASLCNTSPNVDCTITFTKDGVVKSLPTKRTDSSGAAYWDLWKPKDIGLTAGNWIVTAVVNAAKQSDSTPDPVPLEVLP